MIVQLITPSDPYTFDSPDIEIAAVVVCTLGSGQFEGVDAYSASLLVPYFFFNDDGRDEWFKRKFGRPYRATRDYCINCRKRVLIDALDSVLIGGAKQRCDYEEVLQYLPAEHHLRFRLAWHDERRTSPVDVGRKAWSSALYLTPGDGTPEPALGELV
jgi:hypothetical protein